MFLYGIPILITVTVYKYNIYKLVCKLSLTWKLRAISLYNSPPYGTITAGKNTSGLQSSYLTSYTTPSSMSQYSSYATYNSGTTNFPNVAQNISPSSQVLKKKETIRIYYSYYPHYRFIYGFSEARLQRLQ